MISVIVSLSWAYISDYESDIHVTPVQRGHIPHGVH